MKSVFHNDLITLNLSKYGVIRQISSRYLFYAAVAEYSDPETNHSRNVEENFCRFLFNNTRFPEYQMFAKECTKKTLSDNFSAEKSDIFRNFSIRCAKKNDSTLARCWKTIGSAGFKYQAQRRQLENPFLFNGNKWISIL